MGLLYTKKVLHLVANISTNNCINTPGMEHSHRGFDRKWSTWANIRTAVLENPKYVSILMPRGNICLVTCTS